MSGEEMTPEEIEAFAREMEEHAFEDRIVAELECVPDLSVAIPADFAARVAAQVPARREVSVTPTHYGRTVMWVSFAVLFVSLVALSVKGFAGSTIDMALEWSLCAQFLAIAVWIGVRRWRAN